VILLTLDLLGTFAFAITGVVKASNRGLDWFGAIVLALVTGTGGGIMRDALIGCNPPIVLQRPVYFILCISAAIITMIAQRKILSKWIIVRVADALGLGAFTAIGAIYAEDAGAGGLAIVSLSVLTAVGGGMLRDILAGEIPQILKSDFYATAALIGGIFYWAFGFFTSEFNELKIFLTIALTILLRLYAMFAKLNLPTVKE